MLERPPDIPCHPFLLAGTWKIIEDPPAIYLQEVRNPYDNSLVGIVSRAGEDELEYAIRSAVSAAPVTRALPAHRRATILRTVSENLGNRSEEFARLIAQEAGKPIKQARVEVQRAQFTFAQAAEEVTRIAGNVLTMDASPVGEGRQGIVRRFPIGPIAAITPFNFPLNLVAHKLAPAIAAGCPVILKPAPQTPITALLLARIVKSAGWPGQALSVLPMDVEMAAPLVEDDRLKLLTFTGSAAVGWALKARAGRKRVLLELGGNAGLIIHKDADLAQAATRAVAGGFAYAGQSCISVQRILVQREVYDAFLEQFIPLVQALKVGDPLDDTTDLSALINPAAGERIAAWLDEARAAGADVLLGGGIENNIMQPTVIANAAPDLRVNCQEVFAPLVTVQPYDAFDEALDVLNCSDFGLQAGVFTNDLRLVWQAYDTLEVGGVIINDIPSWRVDHMPYGGIKQSGLGREGLQYAIEEMTEPRLLVLNLS